jgi:hypothetical protein
MSRIRRPFLLWLIAGGLVPLALGGAGAMFASIDFPAAGRTCEILALGSCPFWVFLWLPAMSHPTNSVLFYSAVVAVLAANGCLYLVMAQVQSKIRPWRLPLRIAVLVLAYPAVMALGYCVPLGMEYLSGLESDGRVT